jgi:hypothetical protein
MKPLPSNAADLMDSRRGEDGGAERGGGELRFHDLRFRG